MNRCWLTGWRLRETPRRWELLAWLPAVLLTALLLIGVSGCSRPAAKDARRKEPGPGEKFARFEKELRRLCQEGHASLIANATGGAGLTSIRTAMDPPTAVWHPPQTPEGENTAEVTIVTRLTYSSLAPDAIAEEAPSKIKAPEKRNPGLLGTKEPEEEERKPTPPVRTFGKQESFRDTYDLVYRHDHWRIASREVPESMRMLLERALLAQ